MKGFVRISKYAGMREDLVQAGGGNSSFKVTQNEMVIKASGCQLADITETDGFAVVNPHVIREAFLSGDSVENMTEKKSRAVLESAFIKGKRPSIETFLHTVSGRYSLHTHPIVVNALACRKDGMEVLGRLFPNALLVPYATPGTELAKACFMSFKNRADQPDETFDVIFLQNHGLMVSADTAQEVIEKTEKTLRRIEEYLNVDMEAYHAVTKIWEVFAGQILWRVTDEHVLHAYRKKKSLWDHAFCPDCVVFLGKKALVLHDCFAQEKEEFEKLFGRPVMVIYKNQLYILADCVSKAMEIQSVMSFSAQVMELNAGFECNLLSDREQDFLLNWDAEKYRKNMK